MKTNNIIQEKSFAFAVRIVKLYKYLVEEKKEYLLSKQLMRSGTSIGANVEEAIGGYSKMDFLHKLTIAYKEARESLYWLKLLIASESLSEKEAQSMITDIEEICKIISSIQISSKKNKTS